MLYDVVSEIKQLITKKINIAQDLQGNYCVPGRYHSAYKDTITSLEDSTGHVGKL